VAEHVFHVTVEALLGVETCAKKKSGMYVMYMFPGQEAPLYTHVVEARVRIKQNENHNKLN
jgi:hypothetical protein